MQKRVSRMPANTLHYEPRQIYCSKVFTTISDWSGRAKFIRHVPVPNSTAIPWRVSEGPVQTRTCTPLVVSLELGEASITYGNANA